uniref:Pectinesterase n=1 Tax=Leersia perrieri TaxID=77586 RepID=A0A0D9VV03_9ORYZ
MASSDGEGEGRGRTKLIIGGLAVFMLVAMVIGTVAFVMMEHGGEDGDLNKRGMSSTTRTVDLFCAPTDYHATCQDTLDRVLARSSDPADHPHAAAAAAITAVERALSQGFDRTSSLAAIESSNDTLVAEALRDCRMLLDDCRGDVARALSSIAWRGVDGPAQDLQSWLSAVITFQGSCVDMFPKGEVRDQVRDAMEKAREISSNAIAIIQQGAAFAAMLDLHASEGHGDGNEVDVATMDKDGHHEHHDDDDDVDRRKMLDEEEDVLLPSWVADDDERRMLVAAAAEESVAGLTPNVTVAKDGSGDFGNISAALDALPETYVGRYVIYVKEGVYEETVNVTSRMANITMYGDGSKKSIVTGSKNIADGIRMWKTATFAVDGDRFTAMRLGIRNTAGEEKQQALALRVKSDKTIFFNCRIEGNQDTLFAQAYRQFYRSCVISGTVDFIFGDAAAVFQRCVLLVKPPLPGKPAVVTAHGRRDRQQTTGFVIQHSQVASDDGFATDGEGGTARVAYLGRPWKEHARTVVMESAIEGFVHAQGYMPWEGKDNLGEAFYGEFANSGGGANATGRSEMKGFHVLDKVKAMQFTVGRFLHGADWIPETGTPVTLGLFAAT